MINITDDDLKKDHEVLTVKYLSSIDTKLDAIQKGYMKIFYGMLGMIAASIGVKMVGTPWYVDVSIYVRYLCIVIIFCSIIYCWRELSKPVLWFRFIFIGMILYSLVVRTWMAQTGLEHIPVWYQDGFNVWYVAISVPVLVSVWNRHGEHKLKK